MERSAKAPLSPHEETVLKRLATCGGEPWPQIPDRHVQRLHLFQLVAREGDRLVLTAVGEARVSTLSRG